MKPESSATMKSDQLMAKIFAQEQLLETYERIVSEQTEKLYAEIAVRLKAEAALADYAQELARSNGELEEFANAASHDLQEPLRMVASFVQLLERRYKGKLDSEADEFISFALAGTARMQRLISDLLDYAKVGTRGKELVPVESSAALEQALQNLMIAIKESHTTVTSAPLPRVIADESQLIRLFQNLIANAIKFHGTEPPRIHVGGEQKEGVWVFSVQDNGIGLAPEHFNKIFLIFKRVYSESEYPGTGIGLAVCKKIVERHGGKIWVESEPGKGATFYFTMPQEKRP